MADTRPPSLEGSASFTFGPSASSSAAPKSAMPKVPASYESPRNSVKQKKSPKKVKDDNASDSSSEHSAMDFTFGGGGPNATSMGSGTKLPPVMHAVAEEDAPQDVVSPNLLQAPLTGKEYIFKELLVFLKASPSRVYFRILKFRTLYKLFSPRSSA